MALSLEKTWHHSWNYAPTVSSAGNQNKNIAWFFKAFLMGQLANYYTGAGAGVSPTGVWTCYSSCDGAGGAGSFGNGDSNDRWTSSFDSTKIVQAAAASNHSWFVLKSPVAYGPVYVLIDMNSATGTTFSISQAKTAYAGGTATAAPTSADSAGLSAITFCAGATTQFCHGSLSTDGDFMMYVTNSNGGSTHGEVSTAWIFQSPANKKSTDTYPWAMYFNCTQQAALNAATLGTATNWCGKNVNGTATVAFQACDPHLGGLSTNILNSGTSGGVGLQSYIDGLYDDLPIYLFSNTASHLSIKGRLYDLRWGPNSLPSGYVDPSLSAPTSVKMGDIWVPTYVKPKYINV